MDRLLLTMLLVLTAFPANAAGVSGIFAKGRSNFSLMVGNGYVNDNSYLVVGASATYYVVDGLGVGLSIENWSGSDPNITKYSPYVQYVFYRISVLKPYLGAFYRHSTVTGQPSFDSAGARAGLYYSAGSNAFVSVGMVYEAYLDCKNTIYGSCNSTYPEIGVTIGF
jgi:hypothetical protein